MKTIILGKEGSQPFKIKPDMDGVSRHHAQITITDNGEWYIEDIGSSNGTYIRDEETGEMLPVKEKRWISPMTFILLGPDNSHGCCFYARQILKQNYGSFIEDFQAIMKKDEEHDELLAKLDRRIVRQKQILFIVNVAVMCITFFTKSLDAIIPEFRLNLMRIVPVISTGFAAFYDATSKKKMIENQRVKFHCCPNPKCSHRLKKEDIRNMLCPKCKNKI